VETPQERPSPLPERRQAARGEAFGLRNWPVRSKLVAVLAIPALVLLVLATINVKASLNDAQSLRRGGELARLERSSTALVHELQQERDLTVGVIAQQRSDDPAVAKLIKSRVDSLAAERGAVDQAAAAYEAALTEPRGSASPAVRAQLDDARGELDALDGLRTAISRGGLTQQAIIDEYSQLIAKLQAIDLQAALRGGDDQLAQQVQSFINLSRAKELTSQVRGTLYGIAIDGRFGFGQFQNFADLLAQRQAALEQFTADADDQQRGLFAAAVKGQAVLTVQRVEQAAVARQAQRVLDIDPEQWLAASTTEVELQRTVESQLLSTVIQRAEDLSGAARLRSLRDGALIAIALVVALLGALAIAQSMVRPLQRLRRNALEVAQERLPEAVHQTAAGQTDVEVVRIGGTARDEIGEVARAFDSIHLAAIDLATEQAALRRSISEMFLNLARRSQTLIDRLLEQLDDLEREADSDTLEKLFGVDHLATRLRRTAEGLIVLSGAPEPPRRWVEPIPLMDVVRAAVQEVEDYQRVEVLPIDNVQLTGYAVSEVVHLLAELIENATRFSPPGTVVRIGGQPSGSGHVIEIEDRGIGMSDLELERANERLTNPPAVDAAVARQLGLAVIGRLARRHDIRVQLRHSFYGGITALVLLPAKLTSHAGHQTIPAPTAPGMAELPAPALATGPTAPIGGAYGSGPFDLAGRAGRAGPLPAGVGQAGRGGAGTGPFEVVPGDRGGSGTGQFETVPGDAADRGGSTGPFPQVPGDQGRPAGAFDPIPADAAGRGPGSPGQFPPTPGDQERRAGPFETVPGDVAARGGMGRGPVNRGGPAGAPPGGVGDPGRGAPAGPGPNGPYGGPGDRYQGGPRPDDQGAGRPAPVWPAAPGEGRRAPGGRGPAGAPGYPAPRQGAPVGRYAGPGNGHDEAFDQRGRQGAPAGDEADQREGSEALPIFEQARAQWFQPPTGAARPRRQPTAPPPAAGPRSPRTPAFTPAGPPTPPASQPGATAPPPRPDGGQAQRSGGLPRRMPRANLAEGLRGGPPPGFGPSPASAGAPRRSAPARSRSPEEIRAMLSSYRSGVERGRRTAASPPTEAPRRADRGYDDPSRGGEWG
jgi:HAMP domain-containing protein